MARFSTVVAMLFSVMALTGCVHIDGPYRGKVIDAETESPIEGAVIHGSWRKRHIGGGGEFYDSQETLTDENGEFVLPGQGLLLGTILTHVDDMTLTIFKAGYEELGPAFWRGLRKGSNQAFVWRDDKGIIRLRKMSRQERLKRGMTMPPGEPPRRQRLLKLECNKESIELGKDPNTLYHEEY